ncbi:MAG: class I SAM-dependent methyltransferase [Thermodesulfobacteriota bacterium]
MPHLPFDPQAPLSELLDLARSKYDVYFEPVTIGEERIEILQIADMEDYIERLAAQTSSDLQLPFWAKIWPTSVLLAYFVQKLPHSPASARVLEIGAGIGLCGLFAAKRGFRVTLSDIEPDALLFCQINILQNNLQDHAEVIKADFTADRLEQRFEHILGSEVLYQHASYAPLVDFLRDHLAPTSQAAILLAQGYSRGAKGFFELAEPQFAVQHRVLGYKEGASKEDEKHMSVIYKLTAKKEAGDAP